MVGIFRVKSFFGLYAGIVNMALAIVNFRKCLHCYWRNPKDPSSWHIDETYVKVNGRWVYLYRAVDQRGYTIDFTFLVDLIPNQPIDFLEKI